jgi:hypothetical protein
MTSSQWADTKLTESDTSVGTGSITIANSTTTSIILPKPHCLSCQLVSVNMQLLVAGASAGTITAQVFKRDNSGTPADRTLTAAISIKSDIVTVLSKTYNIPITATAAQNVTFLTGDLCRIDLVASGTVTTQPTMAFAGVWAITRL